ncbi:ATPase inhibitor, mitochondrial-like isoform X1 [Dreissena polymorpha]|uniref:ATPase inhibitor, mitochondrial-like isoform X1 n=1 Tax=Dreissena polymorpha TaxID=45954 RepID=UPI0022648B8E|nr:ATPase inhibitor, mitochondrial-like isoform X1 [Dreissena polymorpha]
MALTLTRKIIQPVRLISVRAMSGDLGSGAGKGGGSGGSIRDAGGAFGKIEAGREEEYFHKLGDKQLKEFQKNMNEQKKFHEEEIKRLEASLARHKEQVKKLDKLDGDSD